MEPASYAGKRSVFSGTTVLTQNLEILKCCTLKKKINWGLMENEFKNRAPLIAR